MLNQLKADTNRQNLGYFLMFLIWPFASFLVALSNFSNRDSRRVVHLFLILFGLTFVTENKDMDSYRIAENFMYIARLPFSDFWKIVGGLYATDTSVDIVLPFLNFIVSRITDDPALLFGVFAAVFGYFYLGSISKLNALEAGKPNINALIHLWFFVFLVPIFYINGFRFYTATWVFFYGTFNYLLSKDRKFIWIALSSILIHYSYLSASGVLLAYVFLGNRNMFYIPLLVASFIIPEVSSGFIESNIGVLGLGIQDRTAGYLSEGYRKGVEISTEESKWFIQWNVKIVGFYIYLVFIVSRTFWRKYTRDIFMERLFSFGILFLSFANFSKVIPSGGRFTTVFFLFAIAYIFALYSRKKTRRLNLLTIIGFFPMLLMTALALRQGFENTNLWLFAPMPFPFTSDAITIAELFFK